MTIIREDCAHLASQVLQACEAFKLKLATAESCTGGLIAVYLTDIAGSSKVVERGFVTYSNEAKNELLGVPIELIDEHGAVSEEVARAMAEGAVKRSRADIAVSVTGIAGPDGGTDSKPVGLVHMAVARQDWKTIHEKHVFEGSRENVRQKAAAVALRLILRNCE